MNGVMVGYTLLEEVFRGERTSIYKARRNSDGRNVLLKRSGGEYPSSVERQQLEREYTLWRHVNDIPGIIHLLDRDEQGKRLTLVLEDVGGVTLEEVLARKELSLESFFSYAASLAKTLGEIHRHNVIHKDIKPANIIIGSEEPEVRITDFSIATKVKETLQGSFSSASLEGSLAYISPEQTGRMNRSIDWRSDLYSLGVCFYEMLTGQLPFQETEALSLIHSHIARSPRPLRQLRSEIPEVLERVVLKLLEKNPDKRYQSALGLYEDIQECASLWKNGGDLNALSLGKHDVSDKFRISENLYGRESLVAMLLTSFEKVSRGDFSILMITGLPGIGKSSLIREVDKLLVETHGLFLSGKYDQVNRGIPYAALIEGFQEMIRSLLSADESALERKRNSLLSALGKNAGVICSVLPDLELIIGKQNPVPELPPIESRNRFERVFISFIRACATAESPLLLFLDDLQWADQASLDLLQKLGEQKDIHHLFVIGAYRDQEVDAAHPLTQVIKNLQDGECAIQQLFLPALDLRAVEQLLSESLKSGPEQLTEFAKLCLAKTGGNPFFLKQFLYTLCEKGVIFFQPEEKTWRWELSLINNLDITNNVIDLMCNKLRVLKKEVQQLLEIAACIGNSFNLKLLSLTSGQSLDELLPLLQEAVEEGFLLEEEKKTIAGGDDSHEGSLQYRFVHDRIQEAVYREIPPEKAKQCHLLIGRILLEKYSPEEVEKDLFTIAKHLNQGKELIEQREERLELVRLNLRVSKKATSSSAYRYAYRCCQSGLSLLGNNGWGEQYELMYALSTEGAETAFLCGAFDDAEKYVADILSHVKTPHEALPAYLTRIQICKARMQLNEAIEVAFDALKLFGVHFPRSPHKGHVLLSYLHTRWVLGRRTPESLLELPLMTDSRILDIVRILIASGVAAYFVSPNLLLLFTFAEIRFFIQYGNHRSAVMYGAYGMVLCGGLNEIDMGYRFGLLSLKLQEKYDEKEYEAKTLLQFATFIQHWKEHLSESKPYLLKAYHSGLENGDTEYAAYAAYVYCEQDFWMGIPLDETEEESHSFDVKLSQLNQKTALIWHRIRTQAIQVLRGEGYREGEALKLNGDIIDGEKTLQNCRKANDLSGQCMIMTYQSFLYLLSGYYQEGLMEAERAFKVIEGKFGSYSAVVLHFYTALLSAATWKESSPSKRRHIRSRLKGIEKKLKFWAEHAPVNYRHKWLLVVGEIYRIDGKTIPAFEHYDEAIRLAGENGYIHEEAMANETAMKLAMEKGMKKVAQGYGEEAYHLYRRWGATAKVMLFEKEYPEMAERWLGSSVSLSATSKESTLSRNTSIHKTITTSGTGGGSSLDLSSLLKATRSLSGEIVLARLVENLLQVVLENAGAQRLVLILNQDGKQYIEGVGSSEAEGKHILEHIPLEDYKDVPMSVLRYVLRSSQNIVIHNALQEREFATDPFILSRKVLSVLCTPVILNGKSIGLLYLEHCSVPGAFTPERIEILDIITAQLAISIENARIYEEIEQKVEERTAQLKQSQQQLIQTEKMASLGQLVAGVAHEVNTPIGIGVTCASHFEEITKNMTKQFQENAIKRSDLEKYLSDAEKSCNLILRNLKRVAELIRSFKMVSADQSSEKRRAFNLLEYIQDILISLKPKLKKGKIEVEVNCPDDIILDSYPGPFAQVLTNFIMNSLMHGFEGRNEGKITIDADARGESEVMLQYRDNGKGIEPEHVSHIFDPFFTTKRNKGGTGLGLHMVFNIVHTTLGGTISCQSEPEKGVCFQLNIPRKAPVSPHPEG